MRLRPHTTALCSAVLLIAAATGLAAATDLQGALFGHLPAGTYRIVGNIYVPSGETLTLAPGVVFQFEDSFWQEYQFDVYGTLLAEGTAAQPILFQKADGADEYNYIRITTSSTRLSHCIFEDIGKVALLNQGGLWIDNCRPVITDCTVRDCYWHGVYVTGSAALPQITRLLCHGNDGDGLDGDNHAGLTLINSEIRDNSGDGVCIADGDNTIVGCLIVRNGEDGIDSHGIFDYSATVINCTIADNGAENLSDTSQFRLYNTIVVGSAGEAAEMLHSFTVSDPDFFRFVDHAGGDYRLTDDSPARDRGTRFGPPATWLPAEDLGGEPRITGIVDLGAYETLTPVGPATEGDYFSPALLRPRMTQPVIRAPGEAFAAWVGLLGEYDIAEVQAELVGPLGDVIPLAVEALARQELQPGSAEVLLLYAPGLETIQEIELRIPPGSIADFYDFRVLVGTDLFRSRQAVRVVDGYPQDWRFIHITDTHIGYDAEEYTAAERLRFFTREANFLNPDFVILSGDVCENQMLGNESFIDSVLAVAAELRVPLFVQPGNHDYYNRGTEEYDPGYPLHYFERVNRFRNAHFRFGRGHFLALTTRHNLGLLEFYRCLGPTSEALDWGSAELAALDPVTDRPLFLMMHGPNYDYFSWNDQNVDRVRALMSDFGVSLCLCGHTHRYETFLNSGDNYLGRNDFEHEQDWERDVPFPGYPLHVQTSSLGKEEHLPIPAGAGESSGVTKADPREGTRLPEPRRRGLFGDDIGWRYVQVRGDEVTFFTADTDGDGYRNTENPWLLGEIQFALETTPEGVIVSTVTNSHFETWSDVRHDIPAEAGADYEATGGAIVRQYPDGTVVVAVDEIAAQSSSVVVLTPAGSDVPEAAPRDGSRWSILPRANPFRGTLSFRVSWRAAQQVLSLIVYDAQGRRIRDLSSQLPGNSRTGATTVVWDGCDEQARSAAPGIYFIRLSDGRRQVVHREVRIS